MECEAAVLGKKGGEGDQVVAILVLLKRVARGGMDEGWAIAASTAAARAAGISGGASAVTAEQTV